MVNSSQPQSNVNLRYCILNIRFATEFAMLVDMPLNSFPLTVSRGTELKLKAAESRIYFDVGFWGDLVPENAFNKSALEDLLQAGVFGLKSFMCPSGINDFPMTNSSHIKVIMGYLLAGSLVGLGV
ncbi:hypothetical protein M0R45_038435 [Rubus argutus]|uniref:Uncharacterized protein n=1 Tax=Rubus argutus TaxID=59490 RepID=A0AAW1W593_RUBAR